MYLSIYYTCLWFCLFWACWVPGDFSGGPGHVFLLRGAPLCGVSIRPIYLSVSLGWVAGLYRFFSSLVLCCGGYGTIEIVGGVCPFLFAVFSLLSALSAGGCLW